LSLFIAENLLKSDEPVWDETKFTVYGKWMDGWESRRKRTEGYDWSIIKLNIPGDVHSFEIDTCHFTGNYSPMVSVQACYLDQDPVSSVLYCVLSYGLNRCNSCVASLFILGKCP
jgi:allantoicase